MVTVEALNTSGRISQKFQPFRVAKFSLSITWVLRDYLLAKMNSRYCHLLHTNEVKLNYGLYELSLGISLQYRILCDVSCLLMVHAHITPVISRRCHSFTCMKILCDIFGLFYGKSMYTAFLSLLPCLPLNVKKQFLSDICNPFLL